MREKRLIDASQIMDFIENGLNNGTFGHDAIEIMTEIEYAPTVDDIEVVRCKDCKHKLDNVSALDWDGVTPLCICRYIKIVNRGYEFCSWGERKTY